MLLRAALHLGLAASALATGLRPRDPTRQCGNPDDSGPAEFDDDDGDDDGPDMDALRVGSSDSSAADTPNVATTGAAAAESIEVDLYFHVVATSEDESEGYISNDTLKKQLDVLNADYSTAGVVFTHRDTTHTVSATWGTNADDSGMKRSLRRGSYNDLNIYYVSSIEGGYLGHSTYPQKDVTEGSDDFNDDGCVILAATVPGGDMEGYNLGRTTTHEVGHWFGLLHTFQGGCENTDGGDRVKDTPAQAGPSDGCPQGRDSCKSSEGEDPIHNFMDYSFDACMEEFTPGQGERMKKFWKRRNDAI